MFKALGVVEEEDEEEGTAVEVGARVEGVAVAELRGMRTESMKPRTKPSSSLVSK